LLKIQDSGCLLTKDEIDNIFYNYDLYEKNSFYIIDKERKEYNEDNRAPDFRTHVEILKKASSEGHTVVVKNMEQFNDKIKEVAEQLGRGTDVHLYLVFSKDGGDSFGWHFDDKPVWIKMLYGQKMFAIRSQAGDTKFVDIHKVKENQCLYIGLKEHKATPMGPSAMLSFGLPNQEDV
jgi:hypothetical protein